MAENLNLSGKHLNLTSCGGGSEYVDLTCLKTTAVAILDNKKMKFVCRVILLAPLCHLEGCALKWQLAYFGPKMAILATFLRY